MTLSNNSQRSQYSLPLLSKLEQLAQSADTPFYCPGHKRGQGTSSALLNVFGHSVFQADLPELPELDNLFAPTGVIAEAQALAAEAFGADKTYFLANGSTCGIMAAILATCSTGDKIILPRNVHRSAIAGLILSGAVPLFLTPEYDSQWDLNYSFPPEALAKTLSEHPDTKAVLLVYPTYQGVCGDIKQIAAICHQRHIPLLVDEAHGPHFKFHSALPVSALEAGADLTVQSTHKVLGAMTQASMLHLQGDRIEPERINQALPLVQSTSPSNILLASLDAARQQMATQGNSLLSQTIQLAAKAREAIAQIPNLSVLSFSAPTPGFQSLDQTRLTVKLDQLGWTGFDADDTLRETWQVTAELPSLRHLTFIISLGNRDRDINRLVEALGHLPPQAPLSSSMNFPFPPSSSYLSPREAFFAPTESVAIADCSGRTCAETICPYPPGIPILMPGEVITEASLDYLDKISRLGAGITGFSDSSRKTIKVIR